MVAAGRRLRLAFMGTPEFAATALRALADTRHELVVVYTQPPRPTGRGHKTHPSPVHQLAESLGIPVRHPPTLKDAEAQAAFAALDLDLAVVAAYGLILPRPILTAPRLGCVNIHASLLPRWRGAAPIQRAILAGDTVTGVTIMQMEAGLDTGPMLLRGEVPITPQTTATSLHDSLAALGARLIVETLEPLAAGALPAIPQPDQGITYAAKLEREEGRLDWRLSAAEIDRRVRALNPAPGVWFDWGEERIKLLALDALLADGGSETPGTVLDDDLLIRCGDGAIRPAFLQRAGRQAVDRQAFLRGNSIPRGTVLPCPATS
jgi:methionyl-tRNA formyltransferase